MQRRVGAIRSIGTAHRLASVCLVAVLGALLYACGDSLTGPTEPPSSDTPAAETVSDAHPETALSVKPPRMCGPETVVDLVAGRGLIVGSLTVSNDEGEVTVVYRTSEDWELEETQLAVTTSPEAVPTGPSGLPQIGRFPDGAVHEPGTTAFAVTVSLAELDAAEGDELTVAAHADVIARADLADPDGDREEGAWGDGTPFSERGRGNTGTWFGHEVQPCTSVAQTVGSAGGTVEVRAGDGKQGVTLVVPAGALEEPVEITIEPIPLAELVTETSDADAPSADENPSASAAALASSYSTDDLVEGTAYDFGPDGLEFLEPVEVVLGYDEGNLGSEPEVVEELLHVFIVNGIFEPLVPSTVDADADEVSGFTEHFTVFAAGVVEDAPPVEIAVTERISVTDRVSMRGPAGATIGEEISVTDEVTLRVEAPIRVSITETVSVSDAVSVEIRGPVSLSVDEAITVTDRVDVSTTGPVDVPVSESITVTDEVAISVDPGSTGPLAYVGAQGDDSVAVVDRSTREVITKIPVGNPFALATRPGGSEVYVGRGGDGAVAVVDVATNSVVATITGFRGTIDLEFRPDGQTAYVSSGGSTSRLDVIDAETRTVTTTIGGLAPFSRGMAVTPGGDSAFVVADDTVTVVDLTTNTAIDKLTGSFTGGDAAVTPDGTTLVVTDLQGAELEIFDLATGTLSAKVSVGARPFGVVVDPTGTTAYTANENSDSVTPVDLSTGTAGTAIPVPGQPYRIAITGDGGAAWVTQRSGGSVALVDLATGDVITSVAVGSFPSDVALTP